MSKVDDIMALVGHLIDLDRRAENEWAEDADYEAREEATTDLRDLIAAALADARSYGAMEAQQRMFPCCGWNDESPAEHCVDCEHAEKRAADLAAARREGAEAMRDECEVLARPWLPKELSSAHHDRHDLADSIRALPLPTGPRQAVLLEDWQLAAAMSEIQPGDELAAGFSFLSWQSGRPDAASALDEARLVQAAVFAANGMGNGNAE